MTGGHGPALAARRGLVVVANRLPVHRASGRGPWVRSPGGLATALHPILDRRGGKWIGWPGGRAGGGLPSDLGYELRALDLTSAEVRGYYDGFSNATLWPLYHDRIREPVFRSDWWTSYRQVNQRFADTIAAAAKHNDTVWIHDYHLQLVPAMLRTLRPDLRIGFFLHIPFPPADLFARLPWRQEILEGIAGAHVIGFQTPRDVDNFTRSAHRLATSGRGDHRHPLQTQTVGAFPISIDAAQWNDLARSRGIEDRVRELRRQLGNPKTMLLGVDRLDYTKGIERRLQSFRDLLASGRLEVPAAVLVQVASPSRDRTAAYKAERSRVEELVGQINGEFGDVGTPAVHYIHQPLDHSEVVTLYRATDVMLVTPFHDGMNLVAKEFVASRIANRGVLVLSEFAGAAVELTGALIVNPHHPEAIADAILIALDMSEAEMTERMSRLRSVVQHNTVHDWAARFISELEAED